MMKLLPRGLVLVALLMPAGALADGFYISPSDVDLTVILAPPPLMGSVAQKADMQAVMDAQNDRTSAQVAMAVGDFKKSIFRFGDIMGPGFTKNDLPYTSAFFERVMVNDSEIVANAKEFFARPRPFITNSDVTPLLIRPGGGGYPSGHSTFAYVTAILLGAMVPEKRDPLFERADLFATTRVISGEHYPTDVEAGHVAGSLIANALMHSPKFMADFEKARAEVRKALKLPDTPAPAP
jgi:acid phosphatase (class A)